jgi:hypothetical protein
MTTILLLLSMVLPLLGVIALQAVLHDRTQRKWMAIFCETQGIPAAIMAGKLSHTSDASDKTPLKPDTRKRISIPLPLPALRPNGKVTHGS